MTTPYTGGRIQVIDADGVVSGALVYTYAAGTTTPLATYTTQALSSPNANPVVCDSNGQAVIWPGASSYRYIVKYPSGVTLTDDDNINSTGSQIGDVSSVSAGDALVGVKSTLTGAVATTQHEVNERTRSVFDFFTAAQIASVIAEDLVQDVTVPVAAAVLACDSLHFPKGKYKVAGAGTLFALRTGQRLDFDNCTFSHLTTVGITFSASTIDDWQITGKLIVTGSGNGIGTAAGLYIVGCNRFTVSGYRGKLISGWHIKIDPGTPSGTARGDQGKFFDCGALNCYYSLEGTPGTGAEYMEFYGYDANLCTFGPTLAAGNWKIIGGNTTDGTNGITLLSGANNGHGSLVGHSCNHNSSYNLRGNGITLGFNVVGCNFYANSNVTGYIWLTDSTGVNISGGSIDSPILADGSTSFCHIKNNQIPGTYAVVSGSRSAYLHIRENTIPTGAGWTTNDPSALSIIARRSTSQSMTAGSAVVAVMDTETIDNRAAYNNSTGVYTVPTWAGGLMHRVDINFNLTAASGIAAGGYVEVRSATVVKGYVPITTVSGTQAIANGTVCFSPVAADAVDVRVFANSGSVTPVLNSSVSTMQVSVED